MPKFTVIMKILEVCHFTTGACGVWARAREEAIRLVECGHEVKIFSSNFVKGTGEIAPREETIGKIKITRFPARKLGGESFMNWDFEREALAYKPDVIVAHNYRQIPTTKALKIARKLRASGRECKVLLVTHAPFVEGNITRSNLAKLAVTAYDKLIGPATINKFDKILTISKWEIPYLLKLGAKKSKIKYIPNGIPEEFFKQKKGHTENKILFLGRISPKKKLDTLIEAAQFIEERDVKIEIVGPPEPEYSRYLKGLVRKFKVQDKINFLPPIYELKEKIKKLDSAKMYVLPSRVEGMPQSLIEAMAREKIVIGSDSIAIRDLIRDNHNGYLFEFNNPRDLARKINLALKGNKEIAKNAKKSVEDFSWPKVIEKINKEIISA